MKPTKSAVKNADARYRALGNAVTVQVAEWIAKRIVAYEKKEKLNARNVPGLR